MNRIAIYREKAGMSIQELADKVDVHVGYLKQVESGYYQASTKLLARIANQLGVSIKDLLGEIKEVAQ